MNHLNEHWEVSPVLRPDLDDDPMGQYRVEPAATRLTAAYFEAEPESPELEAVHAENAAIASLLEAAPDLLKALDTALDEVDELRAEGYPEPEWTAAARAAAAKARPEAK